MFMLSVENPGWLPVSLAVLRHPKGWIILAFINTHAYARWLPRVRYKLALTACRVCMVLCINQPSGQNWFIQAASNDLLCTRNAVIRHFDASSIGFSQATQSNLAKIILKSDNKCGIGLKQHYNEHKRYGKHWCAAGERQRNKECLVLLVNVGIKWSHITRYRVI